MEVKMANANLSEQLAIVATIDPDAYGTGTQSSDIVDMKYFDRVIFIVMAGDLGASATLDFKVQESADGSIWSDLTGKSITQLTQSGGDSDKQAIVEVRADELSAGYRYLKGVMTVGTAASDCGMVAIAGDLRYSPAEDYDLSSVNEIVA